MVLLWMTSKCPSWLPHFLSCPESRLPPDDLGVQGSSASSATSPAAANSLYLPPPQTLMEIKMDASGYTTFLKRLSIILTMLFSMISKFGNLAEGKERKHDAWKLYFYFCKSTFVTVTVLLLMFVRIQKSCLILVLQTDHSGPQFLSLIQVAL